MNVAARTASSTTWLVCRRSTRAPAGCVYFTGGIHLQTSDGKLIACPMVSFFRDEAKEFADEDLARVLASALQDTSPSASDDDWRALPAAISMPIRSQTPPGVTIRSAEGDARGAEPVTGLPPVGSASPRFDGGA
ncbi:hypothetical protein [Xanthobacter sp. KR7-225]|uniref:hypothetical protein n=1 Tax=Xanthobacter sp. KR7-225 TaxID=3156613 RepID=UPI0032B46084